LPALGLLLLTLPRWGALAAEEPAAPPAPERTGPEIIATADIPLRADTDERFAQDVIQRSKGRDPAEKFELRLEALATSVQEESQRFKRDELRLLAIQRLESLSRHWNFYADQLALWRRDLKQATSQYVEDVADLARRRASWETTREAAEQAGGLAPALAGRVGTVLAQIALAEQALSGPLDRQIRLSRRANLVEANIEAGQRAVAAGIAYNDSRLARIDSPPIWELWRDPAGAGDPVRSLQAGLSVETRFMQEYRAAKASYLHRLNLLSLAVLPMLLWLSYRSRKVVATDPAMEASRRVLQRPFSSWLVLVLVGTLVLQPEAPILVHQAALLLALIPVLRLLPAKVYAVLGPWPYAATGLYLLQRLSFLLVANPLYHRSYLLLLTLFTIVLIAWLLWRSRRKDTTAAQPPMQRMARIAGWLAVLVLLVSVVANVFGNVSLAEMLTVGLLDAGYVGLVLYAGVNVLSSVLRALLARRAISRFSIVTQHAGPLLNSITRLLGVAALAGWLVIALNEFRVFRPIRDTVAGVLTFPLRFGQISITLGGVLLFFFSVWLAFWVAKTVRVILQDEVLPKMSLPRGVGSSISSLTYYALVIAGLFVALAAAGFEVSQLAIVVGALGVGIGFGLQNVVNNFVSGLILMFERPIQPGDVVEVSGTSGTVREIGMRATTLSTFEGADVVVPNGVLLNEKLINWTLSDMDRRIDVNLGVAYGSDPRRVLELLGEVARGTPGIATTPEPAVLFTGFGASSIDFGIRAWTNNFGDWVRIRSDLAVRVYEALKAAGIQIPFPQQDVHVRSVAPSAKAALAGLAAPPGTPGDG
jgi:small-conductance mechanosensitive channel